MLAFITNSSYIDSITRRRMRQSLTETFTDIYILDLHGSSRRPQEAPEELRDENVFDIQQGVAIGIFVKEPGKSGPAKVHHAELWGSQERKYAQLSETDLLVTDWTELHDVSRQSCLGSFYFFTPVAFDGIDEYCEGWNLKDALPLSGSGIKTERDKVSIHWTRASIELAIEDFRTLDTAGEFSGAVSYWSTQP